MLHVDWKRLRKLCVTEKQSVSRRCCEGLYSCLKARPNIDAIQRLDGSLASSDQEKAELLNSYFSSVFTHENLTKIPTLESKDDTAQLDDMAISPSMVCSVITKLKSEKSTGPDGWPIEVIKQCSQQISIPLSIIFNKSFQSGVLPQDWKVAYITPIHKKGSCNVSGNYRPVSLTSTIVKIMESIVKSSIFDYLISNDLISYLISLDSYLVILVPRSYYM